MRWLCLFLLLFACAVATAIWYWRTPTPLSTEEQKLVGKWTLPIGPQPPPNAVQQFFELRADRRLVTSGRHLGTKATIVGSTGTWRLEGDHLVFELTAPPSRGSMFERLFGGGPKLVPMTQRMRFLGSDENRILVEADQGAVGTFLRVIE